MLIKSQNHLRASIYLDSLLEFYQAAWPIIEPKTPLVLNWHISYLCHRVQSTYLAREPIPIPSRDTEIICVNCPPGTSKSLLGVMSSAWIFARNPGHRELVFSYSDKNPIRDGEKVREILKSDWYQTLFPQVEIKYGKNQQTRFDTTEHGYRIGAGIEGLGTGEHPDRIWIDDAHKQTEMHSITELENVENWARGTVRTRSARKPQIWAVGQRLHEVDIFNYFLSNNYIDEKTNKRPVEHILIPERYEIYTEDATGNPISGYWDCPCHKKGLDDYDPRTKEGQILWPGLRSESDVRDIEAALTVDVESQLQQRPRSIKGDFIKLEWFNDKLIQREDLPPDATFAMTPHGPMIKFNGIIWGRGWDISGGASSTSDYTAGSKLGVKLIKIKMIPKDGNLHPFPICRWFKDDTVHCRTEEVDGTILTTAQQDGKSCLVFEEQEPGGSGKILCRSHERMLAGYSYKALTITGDKATRGKPFRKICELGDMFLVAGPTILDWQNEVCGFPKLKHDDRFDATTACVNGLQEFIDDLVNRIVASKRRKTGRVIQVG